VLYPLTFQPIYKERVWGGRNLERLYGKPLPPGTLIGESWEICDRPDDVSVIVNGPLAGRDLRWLMEKHAAMLLGFTKPLRGRFPLLIKILDAQEMLSLQVHPPAHKAGELGGEPKTEMWYVADAAPGAELFAGLKRGITQAEFERKIQNGAVADCVHRVAVRGGDAMFLPSGRVHAIGAGIVIFEIQQNSDTTYRVFDWNRIGLDGKLRELHVAESLASIDFNDFEPSLIESHRDRESGWSVQPLADCELFKVDLISATPGQSLTWRRPRATILGAVEGQLIVVGNQVSVELRAGRFCLLPAGLPEAEIRAGTPCHCLRIETT